MLGTGPSTEIPPSIHPDASPGLAPLVAGEARGRSVACDPSSPARPYPWARLATLVPPLRTGLALALVDQVAALCCFAMAAIFVWLVGIPLGFTESLPLALCGALAFGYGAFGLYPGIGINPVIETRQAVISSTAVFAVAVIALGAVQPAMGGLLVLALAWLFSVVVLPAGRMAGRAAFSRWKWWRQPIVILGNGERAHQVAARLRRWRTLGLEPIGHVDRQKDGGNGRPADGLGYVGSPGQVAELIARRGIRWAILALPEENGTKGRRNSEELLAAASHFPHLLVVDETCTLPSLWSQTVDIDGRPGTPGQSSVGARRQPVARGRHTRRATGARKPSVWRCLKRAFDVVASGTLILLVSPIFLLIAVLIRLMSPGPVLYSQERVGRYGHPFRAWKFRTMRPDADRLLKEYLSAHPELREEWASNHKLKDDPRVIPGIGRILRHYSLDEMPQLWNVLCGEMSLVGPRPIVEEEIPKYADDFSLYVQVPPGITGLWQISGRNNTTYARRVSLDSYYVRNWSPWLDYYILLRTIKTVVLREGAY